MKKLNRKLQISKKTISTLNDMELTSVKGGTNYCQGGGTPECETNPNACPSVDCPGGGGSSYGCTGSGDPSFIHCASGGDVTCSGTACVTDSCGG